MFAVGHMAIGYLLGKRLATRLKVNLNVPAVLVLSIIPDIDILLGVEGFHRGPTHSAVVAFLVFVPLFIVYRKRAVPYFLALLSHGLVGDLLVGGNILLFWPVSRNYFSVSPPLPKIPIDGPVNGALELSLFVVATIVMYKANDLRLFFDAQRSNVLLAIPIATVLLPVFVAFPLTVPIELIPPHLFYLIVFSISVLIVLSKKFRRTTAKGKSGS
jgi:membrane-bound metal-dependent hydrolase YbcI (DUF457 family)